MYSFDHQGTGFEGEQHYDTNHYAPSWNDNQYQYDDQYYYNEGHHYESLQQGGTSNIESMMGELMIQNKNILALIADSNAKVEGLAKAVEQLAVRMVENQVAQQASTTTREQGSLPSKPDLEIEQHVELKEDRCEDLADVCPYESKMDPQENSNLTVEDGCEVWKPSFSTVEYTRSKEKNGTQGVESKTRQEGGIRKKC